MPIDYSNPAIRVLVGMTCGPNFPVPEGGEREVRDECEVMAIALGGAVSEYCGCPCKHLEDPVCDPSSPPEVRMSRLPGSFDALGEELRSILASTDPETQDFSFVYRFGYCADEVRDAYERIMTLHEYTPPRDPEACRPEIAIDEDLFNTPAGLWLEFAAKIGMLSYDTFEQPWTVDLALGGQAANGFYGLFGGRVIFMPTTSQGVNLGETGREAGTVYGAMGFADAGYYFVISATFGVRLFADFNIGTFWADEEVQVSPGNWTDNMGAEVQIGLGSGLKLMIWPIEGFTMGLGLAYSATVTDTPLPQHSLLFSLDMGFRLMNF